MIEGGLIEVREWQQSFKSRLLKRTHATKDYLKHLIIVAGEHESDPILHVYFAGMEMEITEREKWEVLLDSLQVDELS